MDAEAYANMVLKPDFSHLSKVILKDNILREWGGEQSFDLDEYISWRAEEEGVSDLVTDEVRRYSALPPTDQFADATGVSEISSESISTGDPQPRRIAKVWKQGSGVGFFANYKWKEKLLCIGPGGIAMYFDSLEISPQNKAARIISLAGSYVELIPHGMDDKSYGFQIVSPSRNFSFSCKYIFRQSHFCVIQRNKSIFF
jgi:hypothetical protein